MKFRFIYTFFGLLFLSFLLMSNRAGRPGTWAGAPGDSGTCATCHTSSGTGNIALTGAPTSYVSGQTYNMTLTITDASAIVGGFQIVATNGINNTQVGTFTADVGQSVNDVSRLVQSTAKAFSGGSVSWPISWTAPSSGAPANIQFYFTGNAANDNFGNGAGDVGYAGNTGNISLPVELSFFEAQAIEDDMVQLTWQTQSETNNDYFEIQRSHNDDGTEFESIGLIRSAEHPNQINNYQFEDRTPILNEYSYYRLKQVDYDGKFSFSNIQSVKIDQQSSFDIFPNPIRKGQSLNITYPTSSSAQRRVHIVNHTGAIVHELTINGSQEIDLPELPGGIYFVSIYENQNRVEVKKLLVQ